MSVFDDYSKSHASAGYGDYYNDTYRSGYYKNQWELIESKILLNLLSKKNLKHKVNNCLDFACGTGRISEFISSNKLCDVVGVDISEPMLKVAKRSINSNVNYINGDISDMNEGAYDVVTAFRFFLNAEDDLRIYAANQIYRVLRENGSIIINIHVTSNSALGVVYRLRNFVKNKIVAKTCSKNEIHKILMNVGFKNIKYIDYSYTPRVGRITDFLPASAYCAIDKMCSYFFPAQCFIVYANK